MMEDFREIERAHDDLLADEAAIEHRLAALTLDHACIRCGEEIEPTRFALGSVECEECKPQRAAATRGAATRR